MANVKNSLKKLMTEVDGAVGVALVDFDGGLTLGTEGGGRALNLEVAGAGNLEVVRAKVRVMEQLGLDDQIEDILISLGRQFHLIRPLVSHPTLFLYVALDREQGNLGMARHQLKAVDADLVV